ncbi:MAG: TonB-dependent receptor [Deltaproteobacteria bacterium]|nr:TonB-dependent receptor [Deltaproteobacteria bacterium]
MSSKPLVARPLDVVAEWSSRAVPAFVLAAIATTGSSQAWAQTSPPPSSSAALPASSASPAPSASPHKDKKPASGDAITVVVTGTRAPTEAIDVPADVKIVGPERLRRPGSKGAPAALTEISGVKLNPRQENAIFTDLEVRGLTGNATSGGNVLVLLDGIPQRRLSGAAYLGALPYESIWREELVKGAMSGLYGRNALAGALQLFSDPGSYENRLEVSTFYEHPTRDGRTALKFSGPIGSEPISGTKLSTYSIAGSYNQTGGWQPRTARQKGDVYLHVNLALSARDTLTLLSGFFTGAEEYVSPVPVDNAGHRLPGVPRNANYGIPDQNSLDLLETRLGARHTRAWSENITTKLTAAYWRGDTDWKIGRPDDRPDTGTIMARFTGNRRSLEISTFTEAELELKGRLTPELAGSLNAGASYEYLTYDMTSTDITTQAEFAATGGRYTRGVPIDYLTRQEPGSSTWVYSDKSKRNTFEHDVGRFARAQLAIADRVFVSGGARSDWFSRTQENPATGERAERSDSAFSPSAGVSVAVLRSADHKLNLFGNRGQGFSPVFRAVNNTQFADVRPESSRSIEVGAKALLWRKTLEMTAVLYELDRFDIVAMNPGTKLQENVGDWRIRGVETDVRVRPIRPLTVYAGFAHRDPIIGRYYANPALQGNKIPFISNQILSAGVEGKAPFDMGAGTEVRYYSSFYGNEQNSFKLPAYALWDLWMFYDATKSIRVAAFVKNILDTDYFSTVFNGVRNGSAFVGTPRTYGVSLRGKF